MELLGLLAVLLLLYLLIAPGLAWAIANRASARAAQAEKLAESQATELRRLSEQLGDLRKQHLLLQARVKAAGATAAEAEVEPEAAAPPTPTVPDRDLAQAARTPPTPQRSAPGEFRFDPDEFSVPAPANAAPPVTPAEPALSSTAAPEAPAVPADRTRQRWDLQPMESPPAEEPPAPPRSAWTETPSAEATTAAPADKPRVWKPKPPGVAAPPPAQEQPRSSPPRSPRPPTSPPRWKTGWPPSPATASGNWPCKTCA